MAPIESGTSSGVGTGRVPFTAPAYASLVEAKKTVPAAGVSHSTRLSTACVFTRITRGGSISTFRTPTTATSM